MPKTAKVSDDWMTPLEAAKHLKVGVRSVYNACATKGLKHAKFGHSTLRLKREWVEEWAEQQAS